jgi:endonuclease III
MKLSMSPYTTRQEIYREDPWKMMMVVFMLNQTSHKQVDQVRDEFFERFPDAESLSKAEESEIASMIKPLGFYNRRAKSWKMFSEQWIRAVKQYGDPINIPLIDLQNMKGVGRYALDSWKVFQLFKYDTEVDDHVLNWYVDWAKKEAERIHREKSDWKPMSVYYLHYEDERGFINNWNKCRDYVCCIMARTVNEALEKTKSIALNQNMAKHIKILGIGFCEFEWTKLPQPIKSDSSFYRKKAESVIDKKVPLLELKESKKYKYD